MLLAAILLLLLQWNHPLAPVAPKATHVLFRQRLRRQTTSYRRSVLNTIGIKLRSIIASQVIAKLNNAEHGVAQLPQQVPGAVLGARESAQNTTQIVLLPPLVAVNVLDHVLDAVDGRAIVATLRPVANRRTLAVLSNIRANHDTVATPQSRGSVAGHIDIPRTQRALQNRILRRGLIDAAAGLHRDPLQALSNFITQHSLLIRSKKIKPLIESSVRGQ